MMFFTIADPANLFLKDAYPGSASFICMQPFIKKSASTKFQNESSNN